MKNWKILLCSFLKLFTLFMFSCKDENRIVKTIENKFWLEKYNHGKYYKLPSFGVFFGSNNKYCAFYKNKSDNWRPYIMGLSDKPSPKSIEECIGTWRIENDSVLVLDSDKYGIFECNNDSLIVKSNFSENKGIVKYYFGFSSPINFLE